MSEQSFILTRRIAGPCPARWSQAAGVVAVGACVSFWQPAGSAWASDNSQASQPAVTATTTGTSTGTTAAWPAGIGVTTASATTTPGTDTSRPLILKPAVAPVPSQQGGETITGTPAKTKPATPEEARIDALRLRGVVNVPTVSDTLLGNWGGFRSTLADFGIGFNGLLSGSFAGNLLHQPSRTMGVQRYIGQSREVDTSNSYLALTYDMGRIGMKDGLAQLQVCTEGSTVGSYPHGLARLCAAYVDQPLFNHHVDLQVGYLANNYQFANPLVGGSISSGSLGPSASLLTELGLSVSGIGAPGVNLGVNFGHFYNLFGIQRSTAPGGFNYEAQTANRYGIRFNDIGAGALVINEVGYRKLAAPGVKKTWIRMAGLGNFSHFTNYSDPKTKTQAAGAYFLADQQFTQPDPAHPVRGLYAGFSYMYASPSAFSYSQYLEGRFYIVGPFKFRPRDQLSFVANRTKVSRSYQDYYVERGYKVQNAVYNFTLAYTYRVIPGLYFNGGLTYAVHPSAIYNREEGNPLIFKFVVVMHI